MLWPASLAQRSRNNSHRHLAIPQHPSAAASSVSSTTIQHADLCHSSPARASRHRTVTATFSHLELYIHLLRSPTPMLQKPRPAWEPSPPRPTSLISRTRLLHARFCQSTTLTFHSLLFLDTAATVNCEHGGCLCMAPAQLPPRPPHLKAPPHPQCHPITPPGSTPTSHAPTHIRHRSGQPIPG